MLAQARGQYELFRAQRLAALETVLESEQGLRNILGLPIADGNRIVPIDTPTLAPYQPDWESSMQEALVQRPELILARDDLKFRQLDLIDQRNLLLPDLHSPAPTASTASAAGWMVLSATMPSAASRPIISMTGRWAYASRCPWDGATLTVRSALPT